MDVDRHMAVRDVGWSNRLVIAGGGWSGVLLMTWRSCVGGRKCRERFGGISM
jgi:hypothetical protein